VRRASWPLLLMAAAMLIGGSVRVAQADVDRDGIALLSAGFVVLGAWVATEVLRRKDDDE